MGNLRRRLVDLARWIDSSAGSLEASVGQDADDGRDRHDAAAAGVDGKMDIVGVRGGKWAVVAALAVGWMACWLSSWQCLNVMSMAIREAFQAKGCRQTYHVSLDE